MLSDTESKLITDLLDIAIALNISCLAIGANARQIILDERYQLATQRLTTDWDFAVQVETWADYKALGQALGETSFKQQNEHRFIHTKSLIPLDIIPFGKIAEPEQALTWPDSEKEMSVLGFQLAYEHAEQISINGHTLKLASLPWHLALKLIAYGERALEKDLFDINFMLEQATEVFSERIFDELADELASEALSYNEAGSFLLGKDLSKQVIPELQERLNQVLTQLTTEPYMDIQRHLLKVQIDNDNRLKDSVERVLAFQQALIS